MPHAPGGSSLHNHSRREGSAVGEAFPPSKKPKPQRGNPVAPPGNILAPPHEAAPLQASSSSAAAAEAGPTGAVIAQFETSTGERSGPQLDVPLDTSPAQLQLIINSLLANEDKVPYSFYVAETEVTANLSAAIGDAESRLEDGVQNAFLSGIAAAGRVLSLRAKRAPEAEAQASLF